MIDEQSAYDAGYAAGCRWQGEVTLENYRLIDSEARAVAKGAHELRDAWMHGFEDGWRI